MRDVNEPDQALLARDELTELPVVVLTDHELAQVAGAVSVEIGIVCTVFDL